MKTSVRKVRAPNERSQRILKPSVLVPKIKALVKTTGKRQGPYKIKKRTETGIGNIVTLITHENAT